MKHSLLLSLTCIFTFFVLLQCKPVSDPGTIGHGGNTEDETLQTELVSPVNLAENQSTDADLTWTKLNGAKKYLLQISSDEQFTSTTVDTLIEERSFQSSALEANTTYFWKVLPQERNRNALWSDTWQFTTGDEDAEKVSVALMAPDDGEELAAGNIRFEWEEVPEADEYHYQLAASDDFSTLVEDSVTSVPSIEVPELNGEETYYWRVSPILSAAPGTWSEIRSVNIAGSSNGEDNEGGDNEGGDNEGGDNEGGDNEGGDNEGGDNEGGDKSDENGDDAPTPEPVEAISLISPDPGASDQPVDLWFEWEAVEGFTDYRLQISTNLSFTNTVLDEIVEGSRYEAALDHDELYFWRVKSSGEENWSDSTEFRTEQAPVLPSPSPSGEFVTAENGDFVLNNESFRFAGTNAYYLPNYEKWNPGFVNRTLDAFEEAGITVVRMWAFYDGYDCGYSQYNANENVIQTSPGVYSESALRDLDRVIAKGKERGIRFILPFVNYWDELGGICQYNTWAGASSPGRNMDFFINNSDTQKWYRDYINMLLNRVNTETGVAYKDEPAIFSWQIIGEGRYSSENGSGQKLRDWYQEIAQYIKSIDTNHMLGTGEEGFDNGSSSEYSVDQYSNRYPINANEGTSYRMNTAIPEIDYGNAHWYGQDFGLGSWSDSHLRAQRAWVDDHARIAAELGKPFILGEYGYQGWGSELVLESNAELWSQVEGNSNVSGSMIWQLTADYEKCYEFGGNICWPGGRQDEELYYNFVQHIQNMANSQ